MPELPEVEVIRQFLTPKLVGQTVAKLDILNSKSFQGDPKFIIDQKIAKLSRLGKQLSIYLANDFILLIHLKMTGQLVYRDSYTTILGHPTPKQNQLKLPHSHTRFIFSFSNHSKLFFNDMRKFGWIRLLSLQEVKQFQSKLSPDLLSKKFTPLYFYRQLQTSSRPVKSLLHDQNRFAGIGNIYANDALFLAAIHPLTSANKISFAKSKKLHLHLLKIIRQSIKAGGSTARDNRYIRPDGTPGQNQYNFRVYQRLRKPCFACSTLIRKITISGRSAFFCPRCQKPFTAGSDSD